MSVRQKDRFEVFKRDKFTCQYCGRSAPEVILEIDHITPHSKDGPDDIINLVTSCRECNSGKSDRELSDDTTIQKMRSQMDESQEKLEQMKMMVEWHKSLANLDQQCIAAASEFWSELTPQYHLNEHGLRALKSCLRRFGLNETLEAMRLSTDQYLEYDADADKSTQESVEKAWQYVEKICASRKKQRKKPYLKDLYYARGILKNRGVCHKGSRRWYQVIQVMEQAIQTGLATEDIQELAKVAENWAGFQESLTHQEDI